MNDFTKFDYSGIKSPCYVVEERLVRNNLRLIQSVAEQSGAKIIMAFKAFALWKLFHITREYIPCSTASSLNEARMAFEKLGSKPHTYAPIYREEEIEQIANLSSHITFNSLRQYEKFGRICHKKGVSCGLRINPEYSEVETELYNPCAPGSRLGITSTQLGDRLPEGIEGLHFHTLCESTSYELEETLSVVERRFGHLIDGLKWINFGGGHLMTRKGYNTQHLIDTIIKFKSRHSGIEVILEPGSAHTWRTGVLVSQVQDIVENNGIKTAMLDVSFACHMPDCLEMPYQPCIIGAEKTDTNGENTYRMGGNSCLSGDYIGFWKFDHELKEGEKIVFEDMNHYTNVKTTMFNGIHHPSVKLRRLNGSFETLREYTFGDYLSIMD
ncbi:MAG: carboxynorspermidine decarboxylase [Paludibacteraceae bacterium]|nr:carboxynorspermidine decarboxylase [Paludibacteraceae bacterium]